VRGRPAGIVSDNGTELTSTAILVWSIGKTSPGTTSPRASRSRTPSSRASTAGCENLVPLTAACARGARFLALGLHRSAGRQPASRRYRTSDPVAPTRCKNLTEAHRSTRDQHNLPDRSRRRGSAPFQPHTQRFVVIRQRDRPQTERPSFVPRGFSASQMRTFEDLDSFCKSSTSHEAGWVRICTVDSLCSHYRYCLRMPLLTMHSPVLGAAVNPEALTQDRAMLPPSVTTPE
jgi:hypothetical protein